MVLIASYNIRKAIASDRRRRPERILEILNEIGADIVVLQEADRRFGARISAIPLHMFAEHGRYRPIVALGHHAGGIGWHGNAILVDAGKIEVERSCRLTLPALEPRGAVLADLRTDQGRLRIVGMHLDLSGLLRRQQAHAVLTQIGQQADRLPLLLAGDLNEWRIGQGCLRDFGLHHRPVPLGPSFHARRPVARLDRMFVSPEVTVLGSGVHRSMLASSASDHLPVWAKLAI
jgi:endonuclease/exonuclease/phosphatase family metal-dependent hydrolase